MGLSFGTLTKIILGVGLGILAVSCLTVTVLFGQYADKRYQLFEKIDVRVNGGIEASLLDCSIAIAVLGCISAVAAIAGIALSIILEDQTLILIIVGGVSSLFAFGCIVAEGVYTLKSVQDNDTNYSPNKGAQKYIKKSIEDLYKGAYEILKAQGLEKGINDWGNVSRSLGTNVTGRYGQTILTYGKLWSTRSNLPGFITLYIDHSEYNGMIVGNYGSDHVVPVASLSFVNKGKYSFTPKYRLCWFKGEKDKRTDYSCKVFKGKKEKGDYFNVDSDYIPKIDNEYIVAGSYISDKEVDYSVESFPICYRKLGAEEEINEDGYEKDTNHYKYSAKKLVKTNFNRFKSERSDTDDQYIYFPHKPKNYEEYYERCLARDEEYGRKKNNFKKIKEDEDEEDENTCEYKSVSFYLNEIEKNYKDSNKGKHTSRYRKYYNGKVRSAYTHWYIDEDAEGFLYVIALINLIIQIFGILFWACGRFLGMLGGGGADDKTPSAGEA